MGSLRERWDSVRTQLRRLFVSYSVLATTFYFSLYILTLGSLFGLVHFRVIRIPDPSPALRKIPMVKEAWGEDFTLTPFWYEFFGAWILTKTTEPFRIVFTMAAVPWIARRMPPSMRKLFGVRILQNSGENASKLSEEATKHAQRAANNAAARAPRQNPPRRDMSTFAAVPSSVDASISRSSSVSKSPVSAPFASEPQSERN